MRGYALAALTAAMVLVPSATSAQQPARAEVTLDAQVFGGAVGYARRVSPTSMLGAEFGIALPQVVFTLQPATGADGSPELEEFLHLALFARMAPTDRLSLDVGVRGGVADLWGCTVSDCWPASMIGAYVQPMLGGRRFRIGTRLTAALVGESREGGPDSSTFAVAITPVLFRLVVPW